MKGELTSVTYTWLAVFLEENTISYDDEPTSLDNCLTIAINFVPERKKRAT